VSGGQAHLGLSYENVSAQKETIGQRKSLLNFSKRLFTNTQISNSKIDRQIGKQLCRSTGLPEGIWDENGF
jgi:hypothetical protein